VFVCLSVRSHISETTYLNFLISLAYYHYGPGSVLLVVAMRSVVYFRFCGRRKYSLTQQGTTLDGRSLSLRERSIVMTVSVCVSVCVCLCGTTRPIFTNFCVHVTYGCGSVLLWRCCDTLCTSGFMDDVLFAQRGRPADGSTAHMQPWTWL